MGESPLDVTSTGFNGRSSSLPVAGPCSGLPSNKVLLTKGDPTSHPHPKPGCTTGIHPWITEYGRQDATEVSLLPTRFARDTEQGNCLLLRKELHACPAGPGGSKEDSGPSSGSGTCE